MKEKELKGKKVLKIDHQSIDRLLTEYQNKKISLQDIINNLDQTFKKMIPLSDQQIIMFITKKPAFDTWLNSAIFNAANEFQYEWQRRETVKELSPLKEQADQVHKGLVNLFSINPLFCLSTGQFITNVNFFHFVIKNKVVTIKEGLEDEIREMFTIYLDNPNKEKAHAIVKEIEDKVNELAKLLPEGIGVFSTPGMPDISGKGLFFPGNPGLFTATGGGLKFNESMLSKVV